MSGLKFIKQNFKSGLSKKIERTWLPLDDLIIIILNINYDNRFEDSNL